MHGQLSRGRARRIIVTSAFEFQKLFFGEIAQALAIDIDANRFFRGFFFFDNRFLVRPFPNTRLDSLKIKGVI
ncbi:hypothetical protein HPHPP11_1252 [Helicobacter pylori Hp P-11]|nr:hypothetical protein HPHPP11_1252 [Helicobacter pylori Hp P-11]